MLKPRPLAAALLAAASLLALARPAIAADLDPGYGDAPPPVAEEKVEFGSGWYIRGDIGVTKLPSLKIATPTTLPTESDPGAIPSAPTPTITSGHGVGYVASLGGGYQFNNWFRTDLVVDFHQPLSTTSQTAAGGVFCPTAVSYTETTNTGTGSVTYTDPVYANGACTGTYNAQLQSYDALVNGYIDLGNWNRVTPYVGAGLGLSFGHYNSTASYVQANGVAYENISYYDAKYATTFTQNFNRSSGASYQTFAWALMAGVSIDVYDHTKLDIGYRYLNLGSIPGLSGTLSEHEIRAGLRYLVDN